MTEEGITAEKNEKCPRCTKKFECKPADISACNCLKVELSKEEYRFISSRFQTCVCNSCLNELKEEYQINFHTNKPNNFMKNTLTMIFVLFLSQIISAQTYAPPVGLPGTSAVYMDSSAFINWATGCAVSRGYQDLSNTSLGYASVGNSSMATGRAQSNAVVSLGDGGSAICTFDVPIKNGPGYDFAIFENGFDDLFLELAFVEVSSDGINFFRFPAHSLTDTTAQTGSFGFTDATKINNLAGKYRAGYGTPFDLQELDGKVELDLDRITHIKIIDVVGSIEGNYASRDFYNNKINDPWPTPFPSGGFDLDAVGVIHQNGVTGLKENREIFSVNVYPNPIDRGDELKIEMTETIVAIELIDGSGRSLIFGKESSISTGELSPGLYCLRITSASKVNVLKLLLR